MEYDVENLPFPAFDGTMNGSLLEDLRYLKGHCDGLEWLIIYEHRELLTIDQDTMLYCKMVITNENGRKLAEFGKEQIFAKCNLREGRDTMFFCRAICLAISKWDAYHPRKSDYRAEDWKDAEEL